MRYEAEPMHVANVMGQHGFGIQTTGGGCMAYERINPATHVTELVTNDSGTDLPQSFSDPISYGRYNEAGDEIQSLAFDMLTEFLKTDLLIQGTANAERSRS